MLIRVPSINDIVCPDVDGSSILTFHHPRHGNVKEEGPERSVRAGRLEREP